MKIGKKARGIMTFVAIIIVIASALAGSMIYENKITANAARELEINDRTIVYYAQVQNVDDLNFLNEGWYQVKSGYVYYLEYFDNAVPIFVKVKNPKEQNGLLVVNQDGSTSFDDSFDGLPKESYEIETSGNSITGEVTGFESITGNQVVYTSIPEALRTANFGDEFTVSGVRYRKASGAVPSGTAALATPIDNPTVGTDGSGRNFIRNGDRYEIAPSSLNINSRNPQTVQGITYYFDRSGRYLGAGSTGEQAYNTYISTTSERTDAPPAPGSNAPPAPTPAAPARPAPKPENTPIGGTHFTLADDGNYYYRETRDGPLLRWNKETNSHTPVQNWYSVSYTLGNQQYTRTIQAGTEREARDLIAGPRPGINSIRVQRTTSDTQTSITQTQSFFDKTYDENTRTWIVSDGRETHEFEDERIASDYQIERNQISLINREYNNWLRQNNLQDSQQNKELFYKYPPSSVARNMIPQALGFNINERRSEQQRYTVIQKPDGSGYIFTLPDGREFQSTTNTPPPELTAILNFQRDHKGAQLQNDKTTTDSEGNRLRVYLWQGKLIDERGEDINSYTTQVQIGGEKFDVTYSYQKGRATPTGINLPDEDNELVTLPLDQELLSFLQANVRQGDDWVLGENKDVTITRQERSFTGRNGRTGTIRETIDRTNSRVTTSSESRETDSNGNLVALSRVNLIEERDNAGRLVPREERRLNYILRQGQSAIDEATSDYEEITKDPVTGEPLEVSLRTGGERSWASSRKGINQGGGAAEQRLSSEKRKWTSRRAFASVERALTEFRGLGYYASLFWEDDQLLEWRNEVDEQFAKFYLGTEYWVSDICGKNIDDEGIGVAYAETPQGLAQVGAHIEAARTQAINNGTDTYYIYKITFNVRNGDWDQDLRAPEELRFNVELKRAPGAGGQAVPRVILFNKEINVSRGGTYGKTGRDAIVKESNVLYSEICMKFSSPLPARWRNIENSELCTPISVSSAVPTKVRTPGQSQGGSGNDPGINDF